MDKWREENNKTNRDWFTTRQTSTTIPEHSCLVSPPKLLSHASYPAYHRQSLTNPPRLQDFVMFACACTLLPPSRSSLQSGICMTTGRMSRCRATRPFFTSKSLCTYSRHLIGVPPCCLQAPDHVDGQILGPDSRAKPCKMSACAWACAWSWSKWATARSPRKGSGTRGDWV